jgi:hypothetical protein
MAFCPKASSGNIEFLFHSYVPFDSSNFGCLTRNSGNLIPDFNAVDSITQAFVVTPNAHQRSFKLITKTD